MADIVLVRNGRKTDFDLNLAYNVVERVTWRQADHGISLEAYGQLGLWRLLGVEEPLQDAIGLMGMIDYYALPFFDGASAFDAPHSEGA